jgi:DHA1 family bicyclomycin/chloramphenicol resistance-like MFS transporter
MQLRRPAIIALFTACGAMSPTALQIIVPVLPYIRADLHASIAQTQWLVTAFSIALAVAMLACGPVSDRLGRRPLMIGGMIVFTAGSAMASFAGSLWLLIAARIVQAAGAGAASTASRAMAADLYAGEDLTRVMAFTTMGLVVGPLIGPTLAGALADQAGWASVMVLLFVLGAVVTVPTVLGLPETADMHKSPGAAIANPLRDWGRMLADRDISLYVAILVATQVGVYAFISASPYLIVEVLHRSATQYGLFFMYITLGYLAGNFAATRIARSTGTDQAVMIGLVIFVIAWGVMAAFVWAGLLSALTLFAPASLLTFANGLIQPNCHAAAISRAGAKRGTAASLTGFVQIMAGAAGFQIMAFAHADSGSPKAMVVVVGAAAASCAVLAVVIRKRGQSPFPPTGKRGLSPFSRSRP